MKKVLILGASGMAGHVIYTYLNESKKFDVKGTMNSTSFNGNTIKLDVHDQDNLVDTINSFKPNVLINCIGLLISNSNKFRDDAIYLNAYLPHKLARLSFEIGFKLIHLSTDCVFSGKDGGYTESSIKDAADIYGLTKSLGEVSDAKNLTIRTSIIGPEIKPTGEGLFHWFMKQHTKVYGYKSSIWSGVTTLELARFIAWVIDNDLAGLFHLTNNDPISKFDLLKLIAFKYHKDILISDEKDYGCNKSFINTNTEVQFEVQGYEEMIENQVQFMSNRIEAYKHYNA